jgi:hypothetical protein
MRSLRRRLDRLGRQCPPPSLPHLYLACVDASGLVLNDGTDATHQWIGRYYAELPGPVHVLVGIDPFEVLGRVIGEG